MNKIYSRKGDKGTTDLFSGERVEKIDPRVEAYGTVDELNTILGVAKNYASEEVKNIIQNIQIRLFYLTSELATSEKSKVIKMMNENEITELETLIDNLTNKIPPLENFVIPGGKGAGAYIHLTRTVCRRAERRIIAAGKVYQINPLIIKYFNRLSDLLFTLARYSNIIYGEGDTLISRDGIRSQKLG